MPTRRMRWTGRGRLTAVAAAAAGVLMAGASGAGALTLSAATPGHGPAAGQWPMAGQNIDDTHFQAAEHKISPASVGRLAPRWTLTAAGAVSATPTVYENSVYWGSGYCGTGCIGSGPLTNNDKVYAFGLR
jgi:hypothetical protein